MDSISRIRVEPAAEDAQTPLSGSAVAAVAGELADAFTPVSGIGKGGMGVVFLARDRRLGRFVAIKRLNETSRNDAMLRRRFLQEAHAMAALNHIHIVHVYALGEDAEGPYIVMEYVAGPVASPAQEADMPNAPFSLEDLVRRRGPLETGEAAALILKIARAVAYAHSTGVIHRDLKPANVLIDSTGEPKLVDFGLARLLDSSALALTLPGEKIISLGYAAPEQELDAANVDERADVYGLGGLLFFALTGRNPRYFRAQEVPEELRDALASALDPDRNTRCRSAREFADMLAAASGRADGDAGDEDGTQEKRTTWRCKWCDTLNPSTLRFCTSCGWDGFVECPECGEQTVTGVRYCQKCGADARAYEAAAAALRRIRRAAAEKRWDDIPAEAVRARGFVASGPNGRKLAREMAELAHEASRNMKELDALSAAIPEDVKSGNYEKAQERIARYREISREGSGAFAAEAASIPGLVFDRDLGLASEAAKAGDRETLERLFGRLSAARPGAPELKGLSSALAAMRRKSRSARLAALAATCIAAFAAAAAAIAFTGGGPDAAPPEPKAAPGGSAPHHAARGSSADAAAACEETLRMTIRSAQVSEQLDADGRFADPFVRSVAAVAVAANLVAPSGEPKAVETTRENFINSMAALSKRRVESAASLPNEYSAELESLLHRFQRDGDLDGMMAVETEMERAAALRDTGADVFEKPEGEESAPAELEALRSKFRAAASERFVADCRELCGYTRAYAGILAGQRKLSMQRDDMASAMRLRAEEKELEASASVKKARDAVRAADEAAAELAAAKEPAAERDARPEPSAGLKPYVLMPVENAGAATNRTDSRASGAQPRPVILMMAAPVQTPPGAQEAPRPEQDAGGAALRDAGGGESDGRDDGADKAEDRNET